MLGKQEAVLLGSGQLTDRYFLELERGFQTFKQADKRVHINNSTANELYPAAQEDIQVSSDTGYLVPTTKWHSNSRLVPFGSC